MDTGVSIVLTQEQARFVEQLVAKGAFDTAQDVVAAALASFADQEVHFEQWLHDAVLPVYDEMIAHPDRALPGDEVFARLQQRHAARTAQQG